MDIFLRGKSNFLKKSSYIDYILYGLVLVFIVIGIIISVNRYRQYEVYYIDFGEYDQSIWEVAHFQPPILDHFVLGYIPIFADYFTPSVFLLAPFYWVTSSHVMILYAQAIIVGLSGLVLYLIGKELLKDKFLSSVIVIGYFLFVGLQNAVITEFHELTVMTLPFMLIFWAFVKEKKRLFFLFLILTLGFKEVTFLLGIGIGIAVYFLKPSWRKEAVATIFISILWGIATLKFIIPALSPGKYLYAENLPDTWSERFTALFNNSQKRHTLFYSFLSFGFLPILSPQFWFMMLQDYASRFIPNFATRWDLGLHYNAESAVTLSIASLYSIKKLLKMKQFKKYKYSLGFLFIVLALFLNRFILHGPFNLVYNPAFYNHTKDFAFLDIMVNKVPQNATVAAQNNVAAHLTHQRVWLLKDNYDEHKPAYVLIDARKDQNPNNYLGVNHLNTLTEVIKGDPHFQLIYHTDEQYEFKRK